MDERRTGGRPIVATENDIPILMVCTACTNRVERTYASLRDNEKLECPACGRDMASERAAVIDHNEAIGRTISGAWPNGGR
jgi:hypothetical protein